MEGGIGTIKSSRYGFNKPNAKSTAAMARCGQRAILGFNMRKLTREWSSMQSTEIAADFAGVWPFLVNRPPRSTWPLLVRIRD